MEASEYAGAVPRPKLAPGQKKTDAVQVKLTVAEREVFDRLLEARRRELGPGVEVSDAGLLRWLFWKEATARGLASMDESPTRLSPPAPPKRKRSGKI
jgi:hypothetical protein